MSDWVKLTNGYPMPPLDQRVLVYTGKAERPTIFAAERRENPDKYRWWSIDDDDQIAIAGEAVTHWCVMPVAFPTKTACKVHRDANGVEQR